MLTSNKSSEFQHGLPPMKHQVDDFTTSRDLKYYGILNEMGTGKSLVLIDTATWLFQSQEIDGVLIISDKGAYLNWEMVELPKCLKVPHRIHTYSSHMSTAETKKMQEMFLAKDDCLDILIINMEAFSGERADTVARAFINSHYVLICVDEATSIKNIKSQRSKSLIQLARYCDYRRIMTGTPITQSPLDLFSMCEFLEPGILGHRTFVGFRSEYAVMKQMNFGSRSFQTIAGYRNLEKLSAKIRTFTCRRTKTECLDLPEKVYEQIFIEQTPEQKKLYDDLKTYAMSQFEQGLLTTTSAITTVNKLHQINCGHVKLDDGTTIDIPNNRITALVELLEKISGKVLIWCAFQRDVELIMQRLYKTNEFGNGCYAVHYYGKTTQTERASSLQSFETDESCRWFVGTAATGGKGLTLTQATTTIYYSNSDSAEDRWQSEDRNHRKGQMNKVTYFDLITPKTVDGRILARLKQKKDIAYSVLDEFRDLLAG